MDYDAAAESLPDRPIVLFDADCPLCRTLADHAARRSGSDLSFRSWQDFQQSPLLAADKRSLAADRLRVLAGDQLLEGDAAWSFLIANYRDLAGLNWLAAKAGLYPQVSRAMATTGWWARRLCRRCPQRLRR